MGHRLQIDLQRRYQQMEHFGASGAWTIDPIGAMWSEENKLKLAQLLFSRTEGIGLSAWRFAIGSGSADGKRDYPPPMQWRGHTETFKSREDAPYDWSAHAGQQWFMREARQHGVDVFIAMVYSPPVWMTVNGGISPDSTVGHSNLAQERFADFAAYLTDIVRHFADEGLPFTAVSPVNEPSWAWDDSAQEGNRYTNDSIKQIVKELSARIGTHGLTTEIDIPEAAEILTLLDDEDVQELDPQLSQYTVGERGAEKYGGKCREYIRDFLGDPSIAPLIGNKLSYHAYWADQNNGGPFDRLVTYRAKLRETLARHAPEAKLWQTEYCNLNDDGPGRDLGMGLALLLATVVHMDLTVAQASAWHWWLAVSPHDYKDGLIYTDFAAPGDEQTIYCSKALWTLGQYSRFIRPGAVRIAVEGDDDHYDSERVMASAYVHDEEQTLTIVLINRMERQEEVHISAIREVCANLEAYVTSDNDGDNLRRLPLPDQNELILPGRSITTLYGRLV